MRPRVSVLLPVRDGGDLLAAAVDSILDQDFDDLELIVIDDHSRDGAVAALSAADRRLRRVSNRGAGLIDALNTGIGTARGSFIGRMDADDLSLPGRVRTQLAYLADRPDVDIAGARVEIFSDQPLGGGNRRYQAWVNHLVEPGDIHRERFVESPVPHPTWLMPAEVMERLGGYRDAGWPEDYDWLLRACAAGFRFGKPEPVLLRWRDHPGRATRRDPRYEAARFTAARARFLARGPLAGRDTVIWGAGPGGRKLHDALAGEGVRVTAFLDVHPRRIGGRKRDLPVWHFSELDQRARDSFVTVAVGVPSARPEIRLHLRAAGRREGEDWVFAA